MENISEDGFAAITLSWHGITFVDRYSILGLAVLLTMDHLLEHFSDLSGIMNIRYFVRYLASCHGLCLPPSLRPNVSETITSTSVMVYTGSYSAGLCSVLPVPVTTVVP